MSRCCAVVAFFIAAGGVLSGQPSVQVTSPTTGSVVQSGQTLQVAVTASGGTFAHMGVIGTGDIGSSDDLTAPPYSFSLAIPATIQPGWHTLRASGIILNGEGVAPTLVEASPIQIDVERSDTPTDVGNDRNELTTIVGKKSTVTWTATFSDGAVLDVTESTLVAFSSDTPTVATVDQYGDITAVAAGTATIEMTYGSLSAYVTVTVSPKLAVDPVKYSLYTGGSVQLYADWAVPEGTDKSVQWSLSPVVGSITSDGVYTAPATLSSTYQTITATATSVADPTVTATATLNLFPGVTISLSPATATVAAGQSQKLTATVTDHNGAGATWTMSPDTLGSLMRGSDLVATSAWDVPTATYTAPATVATETTVTVTATSVHDTTKTASAVLHVLPLVAPPTFDIPTGHYTTAQSVTISSSTAGATVRYTLDGSEPSRTHGNTFQNALTISSSVTVRAMAYATAAADSATSMASYEIVPACTRGTVSGYQYKRAITIAAAMAPSADMANFPLLVAGTYSWLATTSNGGRVANANGYDILFTSDAEGTNVLDHEVESYSASDGAVALWVRVPVLSNSSDTTLYMWYGNTAVTCSQAHRAGVWDANYQMVLHLSEAGEPYVDSSANGYLSTGGVAPAQTTGRIGKAQTFNGTSQYIVYASAQSPNPNGAVTLEGWMQSPADGSGGYVLGKWQNDGASIDSESFYLSARAYPTYGYVGWAFVDTTRNGYCSGGGDQNWSLPPSGWHHIAVTAPADGNSVVTYWDGQVINSLHCLMTLLATTTDRLAIGAGSLAYGVGHYTGSLDELRISNVVRGADWIWASYVNQSSPATFYTVGSETAM